MTAIGDSTLVKTCTKCKECKPATTDFFVKKLTKLTSRCRICSAADKRQSWADMSDVDKAAFNEKRRVREAKKAPLLKAQAKARYQASTDKFKQRRAAYVQKNKVAVKASQKAYYQKNRAVKIKQAVEYAAKNRDQTNANMRDWHRRKRASDTAYRLRSAVSAHIRYSLAFNKGGQKWETLVDFTLNDLRAHLEKQFVKGMTWENYGRTGWHIDHIQPVTSFDIQSPDDEAFKACWSLSNLRPLWATENISKGNRITHLI